jgi:hypothetical protein
METKDRGENEERLSGEMIAVHSATIRSISIPGE